MCGSAVEVKRSALNGYIFEAEVSYGVQAPGLLCYVQVCCKLGTV